ncbi:MAG: hypothetical protein Kow0010_26500 [Dehalococcoidia bacterium]
MTDNLSTSAHTQLKALMTEHTIEPVYAPTYGSRLNVSESHFAVRRKFAIDGTDGHSREYRRPRIAGYRPRGRNRSEGSHREPLSPASHEPRCTSTSSHSG